MLLTESERIERKKSLHNLYLSTVRGKLHGLLGHAKTNGKSNLVYDDLVYLFNKQEGRCAYSNIPMQTSGDWKISLERLDVTKDYEKNNVVLICNEFNTFIRPAKTKQVGSSGWNRKKFLQFYDTKFKN